MGQSYSAQQLNSVKLPLEQKDFWMLSSGGLLLTLIIVSVYGKWKFTKMAKAIRYERYKFESLQKRLNLALTTLRKWEENPDLVHSRDWNLDYIRMRMEDSTFHNAMINQAKVKIKQFISTALRINLSQNKTIGIASTHGHRIDETFDVTYETDVQGKPTRRVLFRIRTKLTRLPTQSTSATIEQIVECIENFLSPTQVGDNWQPTIQGYIVSMSWNQQAKPTPLLLLEQHSQGVNVSFRTKLMK
ncbi:hypothetical protein IQ238_14670 [Pleurocapsales cyanobacterium LEGE 06147]|nr:hypothetical protein [Pleurocapsales cyanobacterium LEGE 06147]